MKWSRSFPDLSRLHIPFHHTSIHRDLSTALGSFPLSALGHLAGGVSVVVSGLPSGPLRHDDQSPLMAVHRILPPSFTSC